MPVTYEIDREHKRLRTRCVGAVTFDEVVAHFRQLENESGLPERTDVLLDLSEITSVPDSQQIRSVAQQAENSLGQLRLGRCAIVATSDIVFGISRVFEVRAEEAFSATQVFRSFAEAEAWLAAR